MEKDKFKNRLFGRTRGRGNKNINFLTYKKIIKNYELGKINNRKKYILDIGSGYGETTLYLAKNNLDKIVICCEKYIDGNLNLIKKIKSENLNNINIYPGNVNNLLNEVIVNQYFDIVWIFFPDPWPKKKHFKRRLITDYFLEKLYHFIKKGSEIWICTDSSSYISSILNCIFNNQHLYEWKNQFNNHLYLSDYHNIKTKFYKKAIFYGRIPSLFILKKI